MQPTRTTLVLAPLALLFCTAASAQTPLRMGQTVSGRLTEQSMAAEDHPHYDLYTYTGKRGERVRLTMRSGDFDAYLTIGRTGEAGSFEKLVSDDDSGGGFEGTDARVEIELPADGVYAVRAGAGIPLSSGAYTLELASGVARDRAGEGDEHDDDYRPAHVPGGNSAIDPGARPIGAGQTVSDSLRASDPREGSNGARYQDWLYTGRRGELILVTLRSQAFDADLYLGWAREGTFMYIDQEDGRGGGNDALLAITLPADGQYVLRVRNFEIGTRPGAAGPYSLTVERLRG